MVWKKLMNFSFLFTKSTETDVLLYAGCSKRHNSCAAFEWKHNSINGDWYSSGAESPLSDTIKSLFPTVTHMIPSETNKSFFGQKMIIW